MQSVRRRLLESCVVCVFRLNSFREASMLQSDEGAAGQLTFFEDDDGRGLASERHIGRDVNKLDRPRARRRSSMGASYGSCPARCGYVFEETSRVSDESPLPLKLLFKKMLSPSAEVGVHEPTRFGHQQGGDTLIRRSSTRLAFCRA